jgi:hypothetical protein
MKLKYEIVIIATFRGPKFILVRGYTQTPIPGAARSKAWVCGRLLPGIVSSNLAGALDISLFRVLCVVT